MLSIWENLYKLLKEEPISSSVQTQKEKTLKELKKMKLIWKFFSKKTKQKQEGKKIEQKKKDIILKVKINNFDLDMQMDTGSEITVIPKNYWECIGKPTLQKSSLQLCQFDGSVIKTFVYFEDSLELEDKFEVISIIVTACKKNHKLFGNDVLNINSTKLINEIKMEKNWKVKKTIKLV